MVGGLNRLLPKEIRSRQWQISEKSRQTGLNRNSIKIQEKTTLHTPLCFTETRPSEYTECQAFFQVVRIGSPRPPRKGVMLPPLWVQGERHTCLRGGGWGWGQFGRRDRHSGTLCICTCTMIPLWLGLCSLAPTIQHNFSIYVKNWWKKIWWKL
jgi:hypothetical protein